MCESVAYSLKTQNQVIVQSDIPTGPLPLPYSRTAVYFMHVKVNVLQYITCTYKCMYAPLNPSIYGDFMQL